MRAAQVHWRPQRSQSVRWFPIDVPSEVFSELCVSTSCRVASFAGTLQSIWRSDESVEFVLTNSKSWICQQAWKYALSLETPTKRTRVDFSNYRYSTVTTFLFIKIDKCHFDYNSNLFTSNHIIWQIWQVGGISGGLPAEIFGLLSDFCCAAADLTAARIDCSAEIYAQLLERYTSRQLSR